MIVWCIVIYFVFSLIVMDIVKPHNSEYPVLNTILCFFMGGLILIVAAGWGMFELLRGKE